MGGNLPLRPAHAQSVRMYNSQCERFPDLLAVDFRGRYYAERFCPIIVRRRTVLTAWRNIMRAHLLGACASLAFVFLLMSAGAAQEKVATKSVEGTKWLFNGTETTVEFLKDGKFHFSNLKEQNGFWKQEGKSITVNVNDFTLYKFTIDGDRMTGTWERLQGDDKGTKFTTNLTRVKE